LRLREVGYRYSDGKLALDALSFAVGKGEKVALVGPNGAGKSTLLSLMAGLFAPSEGAIEIMGKTLTRKQIAPARRHVGLLFQDPDDQIFMPTVAEDVAFGPMNLGLDEDEVRRRVDSGLRATSLEDYRDRAPHRLSIGEKKRVALAGLLAMSPEILLMDEPTANLDPQGRRELIDVLRGREETLILATHDLGIAFELTSRVIVLSQRILFDGDHAQLLSHPEILKQARLELPSFSLLMQGWGEITGTEFEPPMSVAQALEILRRRETPRSGQS
jgi:cobalt/nickel transport system ATP-binding protein